ncbi:MAG: Crp/Fnr family transcriptional regulator [Anaerolineales bacterium]
MEISRFALFRGASGDTIASVERVSARRVVPAGALLCVEGDAQAPVILVLEGALRVYQANVDGHEQTLALRLAGEVVNLPAAFTDDGRAPANVVAWNAAATVLLVPSAAFVSLATQDPALSLAVMRALAAQARHLNQLVTDLSLRSVRQRLARFLLLESATSEPRSWTHAEIATQLGTAREVISRQMRVLMDLGAVRQERQRLIIADPESLRRIAEE